MGLIKAFLYMFGGYAIGYGMYLLTYSNGFGYLFVLGGLSLVYTLWNTKNE